MGYIQEIEPVLLGQKINSGQQVMTVVPIDSPLVADMNIDNKDIGFIEVNQEVILKLDAFPFHKYGYIEGRLANVDYEAKESTQGNVQFGAYAELLDPVIHSKQGDIALRPGMSFQAEIKLDQRRIIDYFLSTFKQYQQDSLKEQ